MVKLYPVHLIMINTETHLPQNEDQLTQESTHQIPSSSASRRLNSRNSSSMRRDEGYGHQRRSPLDSIFWIFVELIFNVFQILPSIGVLSLAKNENYRAPFFAWVVVYVSGCVARLLILCCRFGNGNQSTEQDTFQPSLGSSFAISFSHVSDDESGHVTESPEAFSFRLNGLVDHFLMALDCFFVVWFVVGTVWIFGGHSSPSDAPQLYSLCIMLLIISGIRYAMPFILLLLCCCCLLCIIYVLGIRGNFSQNSGATVEDVYNAPLN